MKLSDEKGQAMVELALLLPLLLLIVFGITEFGRAWLVSNALTNAAREGARRASISATDPTIDPARAALRDHVADACPFPIDQSNITITSTAAPPQHGVDTITVAVTYPFKSVVPFIDALKAITLKGQASMFYE